MQAASMRVFIQMLVVTIIAMHCSNTTPIAPIETLQGNCIGMIKDTRGAPVKGAAVFLVPEEYSPLSPDTGIARINSTASDGLGRFGFTVANPGLYNLLAKNKNLYSMRRPIRISADARVILDDEVLREPGSLSGIVHLEGMSDHRAAIILFVGTNVYTKPSDATGAFAVAALAQGSYVMRLLTAHNDFAVMETTVTVTSGMQTALPCIDLHKKFVAVVDSLSVAYDSLMMRVLLTWPAIDTAKIKNYAIYCNRSTNLKPIAKADKTASSITFDIIDSPVDTFNYQISAIGKDGTEGPSTEGKPLVKTSAILLNKINVALSLDGLPDDNPIFADYQDNIYLVSRQKITKLDSNGTVLGEFKVSSDTVFYKYPLGNFQIRFDTVGNVYALISTSDSLLLLKLNSDLKVIKALPTNSFQSGIPYSLVVSAAGAIKVNESYSFQTFSNIYDPQYCLIETIYVLEKQYIDHSVICHDTIVGLLHDASRGTYRIVFYDDGFHEISSPIAFDRNADCNELTSFVPQGYSPSGSFYLASKDLFAIMYCAEAETTRLLLFIDSRKQAIARMLYDNVGYTGIPNDIFFGSKGDFYSLSAAEKNFLLNYSMTRVVKPKSR
jgi:hypothetical protein